VAWYVNLIIPSHPAYRIVASGRFFDAHHQTINYSFTLDR